MAFESVARIPLQLSRDCIVASVQVDLSDEVIGRFRKDLLEFLQQTGAKGTILDVSGLDVIDFDDFTALRQTLTMAELMGAEVVISGLKPGVVSALVELGLRTKGINAALNLDEAFDLIEQLGEDKDHMQQEDA
jgi:rsbT antagonist protein RsbS